MPPGAARSRFSPAPSARNSWSEVLVANSSSWSCEQEQRRDDDAWGVGREAGGGRAARSRRARARRPRPVARTQGRGAQGSCPSRRPRSQPARRPSPRALGARRAWLCQSSIMRSVSARPAPRPERTPAGRARDPPHRRAAARRGRGRRWPPTAAPLGPDESPSERNRRSPGACDRCRHDRRGPGSWVRHPRASTVRAVSRRDCLRWSPHAREYPDGRTRTWYPRQRAYRPAARRLRPARGSSMGHPMFTYDPQDGRRRLRVLPRTVSRSTRAARLRWHRRRSRAVHRGAHLRAGQRPDQGPRAVRDAPRDRGRVDRQPAVPRVHPERTDEGVAPVRPRSCRARRSTGRATSSPPASSWRRTRCSRSSPSARAMPPTSGGTFVSGGSLGNLSALAVARDDGRRKPPRC